VKKSKVSRVLQSSENGTIPYSIHIKAKAKQRNKYPNLPHTNNDHSEQYEMGKRIDGRNAGTLRPLSCELSCLYRADGSALWKSGSTHVLAAVYGPIAPQNMTKEQEESIVSVLIKSGKTEQLTFEYKTFITNVLSSCIDTAKYPRTVVEVVLQDIQSDGSLLSCLLHAAVAALIDAGVDLLYLPVATTCLVKNNPSSSILLDPVSSEEEEEDGNSVIVLVNECNEPTKILGSHTVGSGVSLDRFLSCQQVASRACPAIPAFWRLAIEQKVTRESQTLWSK
jgi:ribonuclease PH